MAVSIMVADGLVSTQKLVITTVVNTKTRFVWVYMEISYQPSLAPRYAYRNARACINTPSNGSAASTQSILDSTSTHPSIFSPSTVKSSHATLFDSNCFPSSFVTLHLMCPIFYPTYPPALSRIHKYTYAFLSLSLSIFALPKPYPRKLQYPHLVSPFTRKFSFEYAHGDNLTIVLCFLASSSSSFIPIF